MPSNAAERNAYLTAPIVLAGIIKSDQESRPVAFSKWNKDVSLQLHKITVAVDVYLRGDLHEKDVDVYYFKFAGSYDGPPPLGYWTRSNENDKGFRRIFFLRWDHGLLRLVCDGKNTCTIPVGSGSHSQTLIRDHDSQSIDSAIAQVLFTKGQGVTNHQFAASLSTSLNYVDEKYSVPKFFEFLQSSDPDIRSAACYCFQSGLNPRYVKNDERVKKTCQAKTTDLPQDSK